MKTSPGMVCVLATGVMQVFATVTVALRLRARERSERGRLSHLVAAARELPLGGEIRERFADGGSLVITSSAEGRR